MTEAFWAAFLTLAATAVQVEAEPSFCQKMAAALPMEEKRVAGTQRAFDMQTMTRAQRWLTGGTTSFSMRLEPVEDTPEEIERLTRMCGGSPCTMEGPFRFTLGLKDGSLHTFEARPGERARVEMVGTRIRCADL